MILHIGCEEMFGDNVFDNLLDDSLPQRGIVNIGMVLRGDDYGGDSLRFAVNVCHGHLRFSIGTDEIENPLFAHLCQAAGKLMRERNRERHEFRGFGACVSKHDTLVSCTTGVDTHRDVG